MQAYIPLKEHFAARGLKLNVLILIKLGIAQRTAQALIYGKPANIKFDHLLKLCDYLNCTPNDLICVTLNNKETFTANHPLQALVNNKPTQTLGRAKLLTPAQLQKLQGKIDELLKEGE